jgi:hypothetical protein
MKEKKENIKYTAEDIRNYLTGQLSHQEMQALEKAALEDPFLADAIEGYEENMHHPLSFESDLQMLNTRLRDRLSQQSKKSRLILWGSSWKVAASLLLVIGSSVFLLTVLYKKDTRNIAADTIRKDSGLAAQKSQPTAVTADSNSLVNTSGNLKSKTKTDSLSIAYVAPEMEKKSSPKKNRHLNKPAADKPIVEFSIVKQSPIVADTAVGNGIVSALAKNDRKKVLPLSTSPVDSLLQGKAAGVQVQTQKNREPIYIKGIVVDSADKPVPFASVLTHGSNKATMTDVNGYFKLYIKNANSSKQLVIAGIGYQTLSADYFADSSLVQKFRMQLSTSALNEVVVSGYGVNDREENASYSTFSTSKASEPEGWDTLNNYIATHKQIQTADSMLKGKEVISFFVDNHGKLSGFKVLKSVSPAHDKKIIELIQTGPPLKISRGKKQKCRITVLFN